ncbi:Protein of unknown function, partial [Gryllus bimaculatus]
MSHHFVPSCQFCLCLFRLLFLFCLPSCSLFCYSTFDEMWLWVGGNGAFVLDHNGTHLQRPPPLTQPRPTLVLSQEPPTTVRSMLRHLQPAKTCVWLFRVLSHIPLASWFPNSIPGSQEHRSPPSFQKN